MDEHLSAPQLKHIVVGPPPAPGGAPRRMAYWAWPCHLGAASRQVVVCVHGLSRQGRDFDALARALLPHAHVVAVDVAGRGGSDWLADPMAYQVPTYAADMAALIAHIKSTVPGAAIDWVGTSMGGLIGMAVASNAALAPRRLVLNDVGPVLNWEALQRIGSYLGQDLSFATPEEAMAYLAAISPGFGPHTPDQWRALSLPQLREKAGRWIAHYDPAIAVPFKALTAGVDEAASRQAVRDGEAAMWAAYDAITSQTLLLRGADSDLLSRETAEQMAARGPRARCVSFAGVGHAPTLVVPDQVAVVRDFLCAL